MTSDTQTHEDIDSCADSECCETKKQMCEQHSSAALRSSCSQVSIPELEADKPSVA
jgi:hypothetical protein